MIKCCYYYPYYYFWSHRRPTLKADVIDTLSVAQFLCHLSRADGIVCSEDLLRSCVISNTICERLNKLYKKPVAPDGGFASQNPGVVWICGMCLLLTSSYILKCCRAKCQQQFLSPNQDTGFLNSISQFIVRTCLKSTQPGSVLMNIIDKFHVKKKNFMWSSF